GAVMRGAVLSADELERRLAEEFPEAFNQKRGLTILDVWYGGSRGRHGTHPHATRPGRTPSRPPLLRPAPGSTNPAPPASLGWVPLAVTTNLNINFMKRPAPGPLIGESRLLKVGKRLVVGEVSIRLDGEEDLVAHATATYSIPPR